MEPNNTNPKNMRFYSIQALTNMHVGSGDADFGVIDKRVQRDLNTGLPTIQASSLKGALREFFAQQPEPLMDIFGGQPGGTTEGSNQKGQQGLWQFLSADMLTRPLRSNKVPYLNATSPTVLSQLLHKFEQFNMPAPAGLEALAQLQPAQNKPLVFSHALQDAVLEEYDWKTSYQSLDQALSPALQALLGPRLVLVECRQFRQLPLPIVARNYLENGESKNLWYEEVVPYDTRFGAFIVTTPALEGPFNQALEQPVQIGANATVGYGLSKIKPFNQQ